MPYYCVLNYTWPLLHATIFCLMLYMYPIRITIGRPIEIMCTIRATLNQLGLIISRLSIGLVNFAFFHLITHALFKSLLFICAGFILVYRKKL